MEKSCSKCGHSNVMAAKFCKACGNPFLPAITATIVKRVIGLCLACNFQNSTAAKFCKACGTQLESHSQDSVPLSSASATSVAHPLPALVPVADPDNAKAVVATPAQAPFAFTNQIEVEKQAPSSPFALRDESDRGRDGIHWSLQQLKGTSPSKQTIWALVVVTALGLGGGGSYFFYQRDQQQKAAEIERVRQQAEAKRQLEIRQVAELELAKKKLEEAEQEKVAAELKAAALAAEQVAAVKQVEQAKTEARVAREQAAKEALAHQQSLDRAEREAKARQQAEYEAVQAQIRARRAELPARVARPQPQDAGLQGGHASSSTPQAVCAPQGNFILRALCESAECGKPQFASTGFCVSLAARSNRDNNIPTR